MDDKQLDIEGLLSEVRRLTNTDFVGLAWSEKSDQIRWRFASGNRNERYKRIVLRLGKGIAGQVIRTGRMMVIEEFHALEEDPREYPIFLSEGLESAAGVPVIIHGRVLGVLLVGNRKHTKFSSDQLELIQSFSEQLGTLLSGVKV